MEILISVAAKIAEYTVGPIGRQLGYLCCYHNNINNLEKQVDLLKDTNQSVQHRVVEATRNAEKIEDGVQKWLSEVEDIIKASEEILVKKGEANMKCSAALCLNLVQRHQLSRKAKKMADEVHGIKNKANFERVSHKGVVLGVGSITEAPDFMSFESRNSTMGQIIDALLDDKFYRIGVYGMGGVGKTMLIQKISRKVMEKGSFDEMVMSTVSQTPDIRRIQGQLGDKLGLKFEQETIEGRAMKLYERLKMVKKILVVLDDVWGSIDLAKIGIPSAENHTGCKILFTSRDKHVLSNDMCTDKNFEIKVLQEDESWNLFKKTAGEIVEACDFKPIALEIVRKCAQLPIALTVVAKALRKSPNLSIWIDALNQLRNPVAMSIRGMNKSVYLPLRVSYDQLECKETKLLFLLCSMFPEDFPIDVEELQRYSMGLGLLEGVHTLAQGRHRTTKLVDDLISSSLLLEFDHFGNNRVKMHDIVRDVAILIASEDDKIRTLSFVPRLNEWQEEKISGNYTAVYLDIGDLHNPPQKLMLPKVQLLTFCGRFPRHELSSYLFQEMKELNVLELRSTKISLLPPLLYSCASLRSLYLVYCELGNIDIIGELNKLEILSFRGSDIIEIPTSMSQLTQLRVLDLSNCYKLEAIPPDILLRLTKLEELNLKTFNRWEGEELNQGRKNANLSELKHLSHLSALSIWIPYEKIMPEQLFSRELNLELFHVTIGPKDINCSRYRRSRRLCLQMESKNLLDDWIKMLLKTAEELHLVGSIAVRVLYSQLDEKVFSHLWHPKLLDFICEIKKSFLKGFSNLESLHVTKLEDSHNIIERHIKESLFNKLREIKVHECNELRILFFNSISNDLSNLEKMKISKCERVEVIIVMDSEEATNKIEFTHLNSLVLRGVPRLASFCSRIEELGSSEKVEKSKSGNDIPFFNDQVSLPNLEELRILRASNLKKIWHNVLIADSFTKLKSVEIIDCHNLEKVFPSNMLRVLRCLKYIDISHCDLLEGIFEVEEPNAAEILPQLSSLRLSDLPNLKYVWSNDPHELLVFDNIRYLNIHRCPKLKRVYPVKVLQQLQMLGIKYDELMKILGSKKSANVVDMELSQSSKAGIIELRDPPKLLSKLQTLRLYGSLDHKCTHWPTEIIPILYQLEDLEVRETFFEEIFPDERTNNVGEPQNVKSYALTDLTLSKLPRLRYLWKEGSQKNPSLLQDLRSLVVTECSSLNSLVPPSVSLRNLRFLTIRKCGRLTHLLDPRVAATLVQLYEMDLQGCESMIGVIAEGSEAEEESDEISFNKLQNVTLRDLPRLTCFYSGKRIIRFPLLETVSIGNCPEMKAFSLGIISTCLETTKIKLYNEDGYLLGRDSKEIIVEDINVTIRQAWESDDSSIQHLFTEQNLKEIQSHHPSSSHAIEESD